MMKKNVYFSVNKNERALQILCYYETKAVIVPYINLRHLLWSGEVMRLEFSSVVITFTPTDDFEVQEFIECVREQWLFELREENDLRIEVCLSEVEGE